MVDAVDTGDEGLWAASENLCDVVILDLMLPHMDGMQILRKLRSADNPVHILVISARDALEDRLAALDAAADDYLVKPFHLAEALARVRALLRRSYSQKSPLVTMGGIALDPGRREARFMENPIELTSLEYRLLEYLLYRSGAVVSRSEIWERVFEDASGGTSNVVDVYIGYLRRKLAAAGSPELIHTRRGHGYILELRQP